MAEQHRQGFYDACDGKGWQKCDEGLPVRESTARDDAAWDAEYDRRDDAARDARTAFVVGQAISTLEEYEALPVGATLFPVRPHEKEQWYWVREPQGYVDRDGSDNMHGVHSALEMSAHDGEKGRVIRSLPTEAA